MANTLLDLLGAPSCAGCRVPGTPLCRRCRNCVASPLVRDAVPACTGVVCAWEYDGPARALVLDLKLRGRRAAATPLAEAMAAEARRVGLGGGVLTWVPARRADVRNRGFDHAEVLAKEVGIRLGLPVRPLLRRTGTRPDQSGLGASQRRRNLKGAFTARASALGVVLVDDLVTTGATATACARALRAAGSPAVEVVAACRAS